MSWDTDEPLPEIDSPRPAFDPIPSVDSRDVSERIRARRLGEYLAKHRGRWSLRGTGIQTQHFLRVNCNCWSCKRCGPRRAGHYK